MINVEVKFPVMEIAMMQEQEARKCTLLKLSSKVTGRVGHFSQNEKSLVDQVVLHYIYHADFKNVKIFYFDACFPFPLAVQSFTT